MKNNISDTKNEQLKQDAAIEAQTGHNTDGSKAADQPDDSLCGSGENALDENGNCPQVRRTSGINGPAPKLSDVLS